MRRGVDERAFRGLVLAVGAVVLASAQDGLLITSAPKGDGVGQCAVGPYGWYCTPTDIATDEVFYTPPATPPVSDFVPPQSQNCADSCVPGCAPPCSAACEATLFAQLESSIVTQRLKEIKYEYFVNPFNGSDWAPGSRSQPWETLNRAFAQIRWLRATNPAEPLDGKDLPGPVLVWLKDASPDQSDPAYMGLTYYV